MAENFNIEQRNYFSDGGKININMLDHISNDTADSINSVNRLLFTPGVLFLPSNISNNFAITVSTPSAGNGTSLSITVGYISADNTNAPFGGVAVDNLGRYIIINKNEVYVEDTKWTSNGWASPRPTDPDLSGTDNQGPTEGYYRNSGNYNIPLLIDSELSDESNTNYIYIKYQQVVVDLGGLTQQTTTDNITFVNAKTHYASGYQIKVVNPNHSSYSEADADDVLRADGWIKIGEVYVTSDAEHNYNGTSSTGNASIPTPGYTQYGYLNGSFVGSPFSGLVGGGPNMIYPQSGDYIDLSTHVNAIGTGIVSSTNPHGLTAADIGVNISAINVYAATTVVAQPGTSYSMDNPLLNLAETDGTAQSYNTIFIDANTNTSNITIRLPEANAEHASYRYTFKRIDSDNTNNVTISVRDATNVTTYNLIDNVTRNSNGDSVKALGDINSTNCMLQVCVGQIANSTHYNWYTV
jgi:hypothetical protein